MTTRIQYKIIALVLLLGIALCGGGIFFKLAVAGPEETSTPGEKLALGEWVYFQTDSEKFYIGSFLGTYVVSTGGCNRMTQSGSNWVCNQWTVQNGWGILYKMIPPPTSENNSDMVNEIHSIIPITDNAGLNTYLRAQIIGSRSGECGSNAACGHLWTDGCTNCGPTDSPGKAGVDLVLYDPKYAGTGLVFDNEF